MIEARLVSRDQAMRCTAEGWQGKEPPRSHQHSSVKAEMPVSEAQSHTFSFNSSVDLQVGNRPNRTKKGANAFWETCGRPLRPVPLRPLCSPLQAWRIHTGPKPEPRGAECCSAGGVCRPGADTQSDRTALRPPLLRALRTQIYIHKYIYFLILSDGGGGFY